MANDGINRKLAAILSADAVGYTRLMAEDEVATVQRIKTYRELIGVRVREHNGRVVDSPGDNLLSELPSALDAVRCAIEIQSALKHRNADLPANQRMEFRVGVHLGDVMIDDDSVYGDGVNIAARLEEFSDPGGICISSTVHEQVRGKLDLGYTDIGQHSVKNISWPVRVFRIPMDGGRVAEEAKDIPLSLAEKPSIAVLPFDNMSSDPEQDYFSDGIVEEIIARLSMNSSLAVKSRNSAFSYKGKQVKVTEVGNELGARYVVEGSVRKAGNQVRITAQLIDATTDNHLWVKTYNRELMDIFSVQDEIAELIASSLNSEYTEAELKRVRRIPTDDLTAYDTYLRGLNHLYMFSKTEEDKGYALLKGAIELDPDFSDAYAYLALFQINSFGLGYDEDPQVLEEGIKYARKAIAIDDSAVLAHVALAQAYRLHRPWFDGQYEQALVEIERAISLNPSYPLAYIVKGAALNSLRRYEEAIQVLKKALHCDPMNDAWCASELGCAFRGLGQYGESISTLREALSQDPHFPVAYWELVATYRALGEYEKAIEVMREGISQGVELPPWYSLPAVCRQLGRYAEGIRILKEALLSDPDNTVLQCELVLSYLAQWQTQHSDDSEILYEALETAQRMVAIDETVLWGHLALGLAHIGLRQIDEAVSEAERMIGIAPEMADGYAWLAYALNCTEEGERAIEMAEKAVRRDHRHAVAAETLGAAYRSAGRYEEAEVLSRQVLSSEPDHFQSYRIRIVLALLYVEIGRMEEARAEAAEVLNLVPHFSVDVWGERNPMKDRTKVERDMAALRKAGLK